MKIEFKHNLESELNIENLTPLQYSGIIRAFEKHHKSHTPNIADIEEEMDKLKIHDSERKVFLAGVKFALNF